MNHTRSSSYDFVELDEEESLSLLQQQGTFCAFPKYSNFQPESAKTSQEDLSLFIRSNSPSNSPEEEKPKQPLLQPPTSFISLNGDSLRLRYNIKGPFFEGRDSSVFRGTLEFRPFSGSQLVDVAVKLYKDDSNALHGAQKEIKIAELARKNDSNLFAKLYYSGTIGGDFVSVWEWIDGGTLDRSISNLPDNCEDFVIKSLADAVALLHSNRIVHHDLKPQNILISKDAKRLVLIDFGDSMLLPGDDAINANYDGCEINYNNNATNNDIKYDGDDKICIKSNTPNSSNFTYRCPLDLGIGLGTLAYTGPELLSRKADTYDPFAADVYSFGVVLFVILNRRSGILPFAALVPHRAVQLILTVQKGFFAGGYNPESPLDSKYFALMRESLNVDPESRPKMHQVLNEINQLLS